MKKLLFGLLLAWAALPLAASEGAWLTDLPKALDCAKSEKKMVLLDFTGSDWCGWCIKFNKDVLSTAQFKEYAAKNLVLVEVDFPTRKKLAPELTKANSALKDKYKINGFPTFVVLNAEGREVGRQEGYSEGGPKSFIAKLDGFKKR